MLSNWIITAALLAQSIAPALPRGTTVDYDEAVDATVARLNLGQFTNKSGIHLLAICVVHKGRRPRAATEVVLHIYRWGPHWEYLKSHDVQLTCGDDKLKLREVDYWSEEDSKHPDERCNEYFDLYAPAQDLQRMLERDRNLDIKIGGREGCVLHTPARSKILKFVKAARSGAY